MPLTADDKLEIMEIAARACHATDSLMPEEWAGLFTEDGMVKVGDDLNLQGKAALLELSTVRRQRSLLKARHECPFVGGPIG